MKHSTIAILAVSLIAFGARAEDATQPPTQAAAPAASPASEAPAALSQSKFLGLLYSGLLYSALGSQARASTQFLRR